jgi:hypothetical protein
MELLTVTTNVCDHDRTAAGSSVTGGRSYSEPGLW